MRTERVELLLGSALRDDGVRYSRNSVTVGPRKLGNGVNRHREYLATSNGIIGAALQV